MNFYCSVLSPLWPYHVTNSYFCYKTRCIIIEDIVHFDGWVNVLLPSDTGPRPEDPLDIPGSPLDVLQTQVPMLSGRSLRHPGILPWCPIRHGSPKLSRECLAHPAILSWCTQAVYRIFQYYFLVLTRPKDFVVMITTSQASRIFELIFYSTIVEVTYIHSHEKVCSQTSVLNLL